MRPSRPILAAALAVVAGACSPIVDTRGNLPDPAAIAEIRPGVHGRADVQQLLGSPSTGGTFDARTWYYISRRTEQTAFLAPRVVDQKVVVVRFDDAGQVAEIETRGLDAAVEVDHVGRATPTLGQELTVLDQLFGNLGRFNTPGGVSRGPTR